MKKNKLKIILVILVLLLSTGCAKTLTDLHKKPVKNEVTGQNLTKNIICQPTNKKTIELYEKNKVNIKKLPKCEDFKVTSGKYEGLWTSVFVKPLSFILIFLGKFVGNYAISLIIVSILIRLIAFPITKKTAVQSELIAKAQPELDKLEKKYQDKTDADSMRKKSQEMAMIYQKYKINPIMGCLFAFIQLPLFIAFLEAINRVPAIFEEKFLFFQLGTTPGVALTKGLIVYLVLTVLVAVSTHFSMKLNTSSNPNNDQVNMMNRMMFLMITFMSVFMTSALNIYWITSNLFTIVQNLIVKRKKV